MPADKSDDPRRAYLTPAAAFRNVSRGDPRPAGIWGFDPATNRPSSWPMRYSLATWSASLGGLKPGMYEFRAAQ